MASVGANGLITSVILVGKLATAESPSFSDAFPHEMGHGIFGFCHINPDTSVFRSRQEPPSTVMGWGNIDEGQLTADDTRTTQAVYAAGLTAGASRAQFVAAGLINP